MLTTNILVLTSSEEPMENKAAAFNWSYIVVGALISDWEIEQW